MDQDTTSAANLHLIGGNVALNFANTVEWHTSREPHEWITSYPDLVAWSEHVGLVTRDQAHALLQMAAQQPAVAQAVWQHAITLREALFRIFHAIATAHTPAADDLAAFNAVLGDAMSRARAHPTANGWAWDWQAADITFDQMLLPVTRAAAELLTSHARTRVRECADDRGCGWLFVDTSKNGQRRWCSMESCGNRAKAKEHYRRKRANV